MSLRPPSYDFIKWLQGWCFPVNFAKFIRIPTLQSTCGPLLHIHKHPPGKFFHNNFKKPLTVVLLNFYLQLRKTILKRLLSYEVSLVRKREKTVQEHRPWDQPKVSFNQKGKACCGFFVRYIYCKQENNV